MANVVLSTKTDVSGVHGKMVHKNSALLSYMGRLSRLVWVVNTTNLFGKIVPLKKSNSLSGC
jgi:hypothetical protein